MSRCKNMVYQEVGEGEMLDTYWCPVCGALRFESHVVTGDDSDITTHTPLHTACQEGLEEVP